jgi:hypothetical protein
VLVNPHPFYPIFSQRSNIIIEIRLKEMIVNKKNIKFAPAKKQRGVFFDA